MWGHGICTQALKKLSNFIFENTEIIRLYAEPFARNILSYYELEKAGFTLEETLHKNTVKNVIVEDMQMYSLIKE